MKNVMLACWARASVAVEIARSAAAQTSRKRSTCAIIASKLLEWACDLAAGPCHYSINGRGACRIPAAGLLLCWSKVARLC
jgi:hypothetical protein